MSFASGQTGVIHLQYQIPPPTVLRVTVPDGRVSLNVTLVVTCTQVDDPEVPVLATCVLPDVSAPLYRPDCFDDAIPDADEDIVKVDGCANVARQ